LANLSLAVICLTVALLLGGAMASGDADREASSNRGSSTLAAPPPSG
jgi:hypothetical protein